MKTARELNGVVVRALGATAAACVLSSFVGSHLLYNWTESVPRGLYWITRGSDVERGELAAAAVPANVDELVRERRYLPPGAVLLKPVAATSGDHVCSSSGTVFVNGEAFGKMLTQDSQGRPLPQVEICRVLADDEVYLASSRAQSFDSRVFGPVKRNDIRGKVTGLWTY